MATCCAPSRAGCAAPRCRPGTSCRSTDRLAVIQYIKYVLAVDRSDPKKPSLFFVNAPPGQPLYIPAPPAPTPALDRARQGSLGTGQVLGMPRQTGKGDGEKAAGLKDDLGFPIHPADLTSGQFKSGPAVQDIFRTMTTGLERNTDAVLPATRSRRRIAGRWLIIFFRCPPSRTRSPGSR